MRRLLFALSVLLLAAPVGAQSWPIGVTPPAFTVPAAGVTGVATNITFQPDNTWDIGASGATRPRNLFLAGTLFLGTAGTQIQSPSDGIITLTNNAGTAFTRLQLGGTTSSFPSLKRTATSVDFRNGDDTAYVNITPNALLIPAGGGIRSAGGVNLIVNTAPTIASGFGTSPSIVAANMTGAFTVNVGTGGSASSGVITLPTATTGWICAVTDTTAAAAHVAYNTVQTASSTTSATFENQTKSTGAAVAWAASDVLSILCHGY